jgi:FMN phosphatase YigB (HAD superfamily)
MAKNLSEFKYLTFDVVGTLIDFEGGLKASLAGIGKSAGMEADGEEALALHRQAGYSDDPGLFPDDLVRVYLAIAPKLGLTNCWIERRHAQKGYGGTIEPSGITQPDHHFTSMAAPSEAAREAAAA